MTYCPLCATSIGHSAKFCTNCGIPIYKARPESPSLELLVAYLGAGNQNYYLRAFNQLDQSGKITGDWNWSACLFTFCWFLYRKMWVHALLYFSLPFVLAAVIGMLAGLTPERDATMGLLCFFCLAGAFVVPGLYGNVLYFRHCKRKIASLPVSSGTIDRLLGELAVRGGTSVAGLLIGGFFAVAALTGLFAAVALPAWQAYALKTDMAHVNLVGTSAALSVENYYLHQGRLPANLAEAGYDAALPEYMSGIEVNGHTGVLTMTMSEAPLIGRQLLMVPVIDDLRQFQWRCMSNDIEDSFLPLPCRRRR